MPQRIVARLAPARAVIVALAVIAALVGLASGHAAAASRGLSIVTAQGREVGTFSGSYALLVGVSDYRAGWPKLESVPGEMKRVKSVLEDNGFIVTQVLDPDGPTLEKTYRDFVDSYGYTESNRLLIYFSGHGYTMDDGARGYLVPVDAPDPRRDPTGFRRKALGMPVILGKARDMVARHALFLFDSCFSGTIFKTKGLPETPPYISALTAQPVRQFLTAGSAGEEVPARSVFTPAFVDALAYGKGDLNKDGYVSGTELGLFLQFTVPAHAHQTPQYGKITDYDLSRGDFVFQVNGASGGTGEGTAQALEEQRRRVEAERKKLEKERAALEEQQRMQAELRALETERARLEKERRDLEAKRQQVAMASKPAEAPATGGQSPSGKTWTDPATGMEFVRVPGGCFRMGSPASEKDRYDDEGPVHEVCVDGFWMGKYEVTNAQYRAFKSGHDSKDYEGHSLNGPDQPVVYVSWEDATAYAAWLSGKGNGRFRLPTEAEWEYAARAGIDSAQYWGDDSGQACGYANVHDRTSKQVNKYSWAAHDCDDGYAVTAPVGRFRPNAFGLYDMLGNVREWCQDWYGGGYYASSPRSNPTGAGGGSDRVDRGGSWYGGPGCVRSAIRYGNTPSDAVSFLGFRLLRTN